MTTSEWRRTKAFMDALRRFIVPLNYYERHRFSWLVVVGATLVALALGVWGLAQIEARNPITITPTTLSEKVGMAFELLRMRIPEGYQQDVSWKLEVARIFVPIAVLAFSLQTLLGFIRVDLRRRTAQHLKRHVIVSGASEASEIMVVNLRAQSYRVVAIRADGREKRGRIRDLEELGAVVIEGHPTDPEALRRAGVRGAKALVALEDADTENFEALLVAKSLVEASGRTSKEALLGIARLSQVSFYEKFLGSDLPSLESEEVNLRVFAEAGAITRTVWQEMSWYTQLRVDDEEVFHAVIFGFGSMGTALILQICQHAFMLGISQRKITILGRDAENAGKEFLATAPWVSDLCEIEFRDIEVLGFAPGFLVRVLQDLGAPIPQLIYITFNDDDLSVHCLIDILRIEDGTPLARAHIKVRVSHRPALTKYLADSLVQSGRTLNVSFFGELDSLYQPTTLFDERADALAKELHLNYQNSNHESPGAASTNWKQLAEVYKDSNRHLADSWQPKLASIACRWNRNSSSNGSDLVVNQQEVEQLARLEHDRWSAEHRSRGFVHAVRRSEALRHHPSLVAWDLLSLAEKEKDRSSVKALLALLESSGGRIVRETHVCVLPSRGDSVDAILEFIAASDSKGHQLVLLTSLRSECEIEVAQATKERFGSSLVLLTPTCQSSELDEPIRLPDSAAARLLIEEAEAILHVPIAQPLRALAPSDPYWPDSIRSEMCEVVEKRLQSDIWRE